MAYAHLGPFVRDKKKSRKYGARRFAYSKFIDTYHLGKSQTTKEAIIEFGFDNGNTSVVICDTDEQPKFVRKTFKRKNFNRPIGTLEASFKATSLNQGNFERKLKLWNIISTWDIYTPYADDVVIL